MENLAYQLMPKLRSQEMNSSNMDMTNFDSSQRLSVQRCQTNFKNGVFEVQNVQTSACVISTGSEFLGPDRRFDYSYEPTTTNNNNMLAQKFVVVNHNSFTNLDNVTIPRRKGEGQKPLFDRNELREVIRLRTKLEMIDSNKDKDPLDNTVSDSHKSSETMELDNLSLVSETSLRDLNVREERVKERSRHDLGNRHNSRKIIDGRSNARKTTKTVRRQKILYVRWDEMSVRKVRGWRCDKMTENLVEFFNSITRDDKLLKLDRYEHQPKYSWLIYHSNRAADRAYKRLLGTSQVFFHNNHRIRYEVEMSRQDKSVRM